MQREASNYAIKLNIIVQLNKARLNLYVPCFRAVCLITLDYTVKYKNRDLLGYCFCALPFFVAFLIDFIFLSQSSNFSQNLNKIQLLITIQCQYFINNFF